MNPTELLEEKYSVNIIQDIRQRMGLDIHDTSLDMEILNMSKNEVFQHIVNWNGLLGRYDDMIKSWIYDIYGVDLDAIK